MNSIIWLIRLFIIPDRSRINSVIQCLIKEQWIVGSIPFSGSIKLFIVPTIASQLDKEKRLDMHYPV